jgi:transcriptional regulator with GAF, ATPase, and Fis domain
MSEQLTDPSESHPPQEAAAVDGEQSSGDFLGPLLHTLAESLDVREIFARISVEARRIVPHDFLMLGLLSEDHQRVRVVALSGELPPIPGDVVVPGALRLPIEAGTFVLNNVKLNPGGRTITALLQLPDGEPPRSIEYDAQPLFRELVGTRNMHSCMRVSVRLRGGVLGGLVFCATEPDAFALTDVVRARQIADCVALAVAHQRLAEEEKRSAEAREHAARLEVHVKHLTEELDAQGRHRILGQSTRWRDVLTQATKVAPTEATVLLCGESGTGKEVIARFIHRASGRSRGPFVAINCAALPEQLLESELFGHEKGAFTGAVSSRSGKIEQASDGVLFLDEVAEMSLAVQAKFLRVLQEREYQRLGGTRTLKADVRVLAATNRDLKTAVSKGTFREDLYYRLAVFDIALPALRERRTDIPLLIDAFVQDISQSMGRPSSEMSPQARGKLAAYAWPGNVRELRNVIERAVILCDGGVITREHLPLAVVADARSEAAAAVSLGLSHAGTLDATEREMIVQALTRAGNNKSKAARLLGLTRAQLRSRIEKHHITADN